MVGRSQFLRKRMLRDCDGQIIVMTSRGGPPFTECVIVVVVGIVAVIVVVVVVVIVV
jgi:hypothetical protein